MASSTGPVRAGAAAMATTAAAASTAAAARGRSASPGQYTSHGIRGARAESMGQSTAGSTLAAWPETSGAAGSMQSPRTPRTGAGAVPGMEFRLNQAVAELQRQADSEKRTVHRQLQQLERRFQDHIATPAVARERWADLQGKVEGMLEEMSSLVRRVEGLDEKLRLRIGGCEETVRQRTQKLEQMLHEQEHKVSLAHSTNEEIQKRQANKLRKVGQAMEEAVRRMDLVEELARRPDGSNGTADRHRALEARMAEHEQRFMSFEDEVRNMPLMPHGVQSSQPDGDQGKTHRGLAYETNSEDEDPALRTLEQDLAALAERHGRMLDEHGADLAKLRVRTDGQEQRLNSVADRIETMVAPLRKGIVSELGQNRDHDKAEFEGKLEQLKLRVQAHGESHEEVAAEVREKLQEVSAQIAAAGLGSRTLSSEHVPELRKLADAHAAHDQAIRRLEACVQEPQHSGVMSAEDLCQMLLRVESVEQRIECIEQSGGDQELSDKADRTDLRRLQTELHELSEPLRRLSQRTASTEARSAALERRVEQLQQLHANDSLGSTSASDGVASSSPQPTQPAEELMAAVSRIDAVANQVKDLKARLLDLESVIESGTPVAARGGMGTAGIAVEGNIAQLQEAMSSVKEQLDSVKDNMEDLQRQSESPMSRSHTSATATTTQLDFKERLQQRVDQVEDSLRSLQADFSSQPQVVNALDSRLGQLERSHKGMQNDAQSLKEKHAEQASAAKKLQEKLEASLADHHSRLSSLDGQLKKSLEGVRQNDRSAEESEILRQQVDDFNQEIQRLEEKIGSMSEALKRMAQNEARKEEAAATLQTQLEETVDSLSERLEKISEECSQALSGGEVSEHIGKLRTEFSSRLDKMAAENQSSGNIQRELDSLRSSISSDLKDRIAEAMQRAESSDKVVAALRSELQQGQSTIKDLSKRVEEAVACVEASEATTQAVREELMCAAPQASAQEPRDVTARDAAPPAIPEEQAFSGGELSVRVHSAYNLTSASPGAYGSSPDAYIVLSVGGKEQQTKVVKNCSFPVWDGELFTFDVNSSSPESRVLTLSVFDKKATGERRNLGWVQVDILQSGVMNPDSQGQWLRGVLPLQQVLSGEIDVEIQFKPEASEAIPCNIVMFSGCRDDQTSADVGNVASFGLQDGESGAGGACTCSMIEALEHKPQLSWANLITDMRKILKEKGYSQIPQLSTSRPMNLKERFSVLGLNPSASGRRRSVLVGINYVGTSSQLSGCHNDVKCMQRFICGHGFNVYNQRVLMDDGDHDQPTKENMVSAIAWLVDGAAPGDSLFFHYSGHGTSVDDTSGEEKDGKDEALVPVDYQSNGFLTDDELAQYLVTPIPAGVQLTCVMDCCHSGTVMDLPYRFRVADQELVAIADAPTQAMPVNRDFVPSKFRKPQRAIGASMLPPKPLSAAASSCADLSIEQVEKLAADLQDKVAAELRDLAKHQEQLGMVQATAGSSPSTALDRLPEVEKLAADLSEKVAAELEHLAKHQEQLGRVQVSALKANATSAPSAALDKLPEVEAGVAKLREQVASELSSLQGQHLEITQVKMSMKGLSEVEEEVRDLGKQVAEELRGLRLHQEELAKAKVTVLSQSASDGRRGLTQAASGMEAGQLQSSGLEAQVQSFSRQVAAELDALTRHQKELQGMKASVTDLSEQVADTKSAVDACQRATAELQQQLKTSGAPKDDDSMSAEDMKRMILREWSRVAKSMVNRGSRIGIVSGGMNPEEDSDGEDEISSYEDDFQEDSMSRGSLR